MDLSKYERFLSNKYGLGVAYKVTKDYEDSCVDSQDFVNETEKLYAITPKTIEEKVLCYLVGNGMFAKDAHKVLEAYKAENTAMDGRWNDAIDGYPLQLIAVVLMGVQRIALKYIDENIPEAWFRSMFEN